MIDIGTDFSGIGSPEEAVKSMGVKHRNIFACERDKYARQSYLANHKPSIFYEDVQQRDNKTAPYVDLYIFGFPCQAFSIAGERRGFEDIRGTLFFNSCDYMREKRPRIFIGENVKGLLSHDRPAGVKSKYGRMFNTILNTLGVSINGQINLHKFDDCLNYHIFYAVLNTKHYGIPQNRERVFIVGFRDEADCLNFNFPGRVNLTACVTDLLESGPIDEKYFLSQTAINRLISGTLSIRSNSARNQFDSGTSLIVANNKGELFQQDVVGCLDANYWKGMDNHSQRSMVLVNSNTKAGYEVANAGDVINYGALYSKTRRGRVSTNVAHTLDTDCTQAVLIPLFGTETNGQAQRIYSPEGIAPALVSSDGGAGSRAGLFMIDYMIRRLTPRETFRLQGFSDQFFDNCAAGLSDTQLYKQSGNSMTKHTIEAVIRQTLRSARII